MPLTPGSSFAIPRAVTPMRASLGIAADHIAIGAVGRLEPQKRFDLLLEAFAVVHARKPEARLIIAGDGSLNKPLTDQRNALGLQDSVIMAGHVTDVIGLHHAFDLFVQSSDYEGTPNSVLEAMAMETPIVATEAGGTAELVHDGEHGRIIPIGKVDRLISGDRSRPRRSRRDQDDGGPRAGSCPGRPVVRGPGASCRRHLRRSHGRHRPVECSQGTPCVTR